MSARYVWLFDKTYDYEGSQILGVYGTRARALAATVKQFAEEREHFDREYADPSRKLDPATGSDVTTWSGNPTYCVWKVPVE